VVDRKNIRVASRRLNRFAVTQHSSHDVTQLVAERFAGRERPA